MKFRVTLETGPFNVRVHVFEEHATGDATLLGDLPGCYPDTALAISERLMGASAEEERADIANWLDARAAEKTTCVADALILEGLADEIRARGTK